MFNIMASLHLLAAIFTIGPLAHAATTASRGLRRGDAELTSESARMLKVYAVASVLTVVFGFGLASAKLPGTDVAVARMSEPWIWMSVVLWAITVGLAWFVMVPALEGATARLSSTTGVHDTDDATRSSVSSLTGRVAASGGIIGLLLAVVVVLMVVKPGA